MVTKTTSENGTKYTVIMNGDDSIVRITHEVNGQHCVDFMAGYELSIKEINEIGKVLYSLKAE